MNDRSFEFPLLGSSCTVFGADAWQERWLRDQWEFEAFRADSRSLTIAIRFARAEPREWRDSAGSPCTTRLAGATVCWQQRGDRWWSTGRLAGGVQLRIGAATADIDVWSTRDFTGFECALHVAICEAVRATGLAPLHAAVVARDREVVALTGRSGTGKSTTLLAAMASGWLPVSEDFAWLDAATGAVYGWDRGIRLTRDGANQFRPEWQSEDWRPDGTGKLFRAYEQFGVRKTAPGSLTRLALLHRDTARASAWEPLTPRDAVRTLYESVGVPLCRRNRQSFAAQAGPLLQRIDVMRLTIGRQPVPL